MTITWKSKFWYEIFYLNGQSLIFQYISTGNDGRHKVRLCNGQETSDIVQGNITKIVELGETNPCQ